MTDVSFLSFVFFITVTTVNNKATNLAKELTVERRKNYRVSIRGPRTEFHVAGLLVERKVLDVDFAKGFVDGWRLPRYRPIVA